MKTINEQIEAIMAQFARLPAASKRAWKRKAQDYCQAKPHMANAGTFWNGLSAVQVLACK